jgi:uncharacterized damage-inducible protein DinB
MPFFRTGLYNHRAPATRGLFHAVAEKGDSMNKDSVLHLQEFQRNYIGAMVHDIAEEKMTAQPGGMVNHPAWQLGHLACVQDQIVKWLGGAPALEAWIPRYGRMSTPLPDRAAYESKQELLRVLDERRAEAARFLKSASADDLARPVPNPHMVRVFPNLGKLVTFLATTHEGWHLGQLATWRKAMGMPTALPG